MTVVFTRAFENVPMSALSSHLVTSLQISIQGPIIGFYVTFSDLAV